MTLIKFNQRAMLYLMFITFLTILYIYFGFDNNAKLRAYFRRSLASKRGRALKSLMISFTYLNNKEKETFIQNLKIIKPLLRFGFQEVIEISKNLKIKFYTLFGTKKNVQNDQLNEFIDDLFFGNVEEVDSDLNYLIERLLKLTVIKIKQ